MRVLQLHNHHRTMGGAMEVLAQEAALLRDSGHAVEQYTVSPPEQTGLSAVRSGMKAVWNVEASRDVARSIERFRPDVVHVHTPFPLLSPAVFRVASRLGVPAVTTQHSFRYSCIAATCFRDGGTCEDCVGKRLKYPGVVHRCYHGSVTASGALTISLALHRQIGTFHRHVTRYLALTEFARDLLVRDGIPAQLVTVKPNFVPDPGEPTALASTEPYVAFVGRLIDVKGVRTLMDAWPRVRSRGLRLKIAGDGDLRPLVEERARNDTTIDYLGWLDETAVTALMAAATCVAVPSEWYEAGQPLVTLRSLSVGTPVLVSDLENLCREVLDDDAGVSFRVGNPQSLAQELDRLMTDGGHLRGLRVRARASYLRRYSPGANLRMLETIYREAMSHTARADHGRITPS